MHISVGLAGVHLQLLGLWIGNISDSLVGARRIGNGTRERFFGVPLIVKFRRVSRTIYSNSPFIRVFTRWHPCLKSFSEII